MAFSTYTPLAVYPADGVQTDFAIPDDFYDIDDVRVVVVLAGEEVPQTRGVDFNIITLGRELTPPFRINGLVRFVLPPVNTAKVVPFILPTAVQDQPFEGRSVTPRQHERVHDRAVQTLAMLLEFFNRSYRSTLATPPGLRTIVAGREGYVPTWDMDGNLIEGPTVAEVDVVASFIDEVVIVAAIAAAVSTVATNVAAVNTAATNISAIIAAPAEASAAANSATLAANWATKAEDSPVITGPDRFSAFHWARKALASATAAAASAAAAAANIVGAILGYATKATPAAGDLFGFVQVSDNTGRKLTFANLISALAAGAFARFDAAQALSAPQKAQILANIGAIFTQYRETPPQVFAFGATNTFTHTMGMKAKEYDCYAVCIVNIGGFVVGDEIAITRGGADAGSDSGVSIYIPNGSTTEVKLVVGVGGPRYIRADTWLNIALSPTYWQLFLKLKA